MDTVSNPECVTSGKIELKRQGLLLKKTKLLFEDEGVLNPAVYQEGQFVHMFYRAVRTGNYSTIGYCLFDGPLNLIKRHEEPLLFPEFDYESHGVEDARIVKIEDTFYLTYSAFDGVNAMGCLATSQDMKTFKKLGIIVPVFTFQEFRRLAECHNKLNDKYARYAHNTLLEKDGKKVLLWDKNLIFFPRKINNKFVFLHRIRPDIQLVKVENLSDLNDEFWILYFIDFEKHILLRPACDHEISYIGGGCPPIETKEGWLLIYHGVHDTAEGYVYSACAALLDLDDPMKVIGRLPYPLLSPEKKWETVGFVNNVVFPTGTAIFDNILYIYYGAADEQIACASVPMDDLIAELLAHPEK